MSPALIFLISLSALVLALLAVVLIRGLLFKPEPIEKENIEPIHVNVDKAVNDLAEMIRCKTISDKNKQNEDEAEFLKFKSKLPALFPCIFEKCSYEEPSDRAILIKWQGKAHGSPTVLMAHFDVVSAIEENWEKPPFDGIIENGVLWGRGTIDTKGTLNGILQAAEALIQSGFTPKNDVYLAFSGDEEINGHGAKDIIALFKERGIAPGIVLDEGGAVVENVMPGVRIPSALIGIAEKGMLNIEYSVDGKGGHSSYPKKEKPIKKLSSVCLKIEGKPPFKMRLSDPTVGMFKKLARYSTLPYRIIFANLWLFAPLLDAITKSAGGEINAIVRTTTAFTQMNGSSGANVIPAHATMVSNHRIIPGETVNSTLKTIENICKPYGVNVRSIGGFEPSVISRTDCEEYSRICRTALATWENILTSPYLMIACSDAYHWGEISDKVYRFSAMKLSGEERSTIHGNNERIPVTTIVKAVEFYTRFILES